MTKLKAAVAKWRDQPAEARKEAVAFIGAGASRSERWSKSDLVSSHGKDSALEFWRGPPEFQRPLRAPRESAGRVSRPGAYARRAPAGRSRYRGASPGVRGLGLCSRGARRGRRDARALRAAVALLKAAQGAK